MNIFRKKKCKIFCVQREENVYFNTRENGSVISISFGGEDYNIFYVREKKECIFK